MENEDGDENKHLSNDEAHKKTMQASERKSSTHDSPSVNKNQREDGGTSGYIVKFWVWFKGILKSVRDDFAKSWLKEGVKFIAYYVIGILSGLGITIINKPDPSYSDGFISRSDGGPGHTYLSPLINHIESTSDVMVRWDANFNGDIVYCRGLRTRGVATLDLLEAFENQFPGCLIAKETTKDDIQFLDLSLGPALDGPYSMAPRRPEPVEIWFCGCDNSVIDDVRRKRDAMFGENNI